MLGILTRIITHQETSTIYPLFDLLNLQYKLVRISLHFYITSVKVLPHLKDFAAELTASMVT